MPLKFITNNLYPEPVNNLFKMTNSPETKDILYAPNTTCINHSPDMDLCVAPFPKMLEENLILITVVKDLMICTGRTLELKDL